MPRPTPDKTVDSHNSASGEEPLLVGEHLNDFVQYQHTGQTWATGVLDDTPFQCPINLRYLLKLFKGYWQIGSNT